MSLFLIFVAAVGYWVSEVYGAPEIFYIAVIFSIIMNIVGYWFSDKVALSVSGARPASREEYFDLYTITDNLSIAAGLPMPKIYVINDPAPNAFATGRNKEHAVVAVTTGLLQILEKSELEGVIAHELSHIGNRDILLMSVVVVLVGLLAIISDTFLRSTFIGRRSDNRSAGGASAFIGLLAIIIAPIVGTLIKLAISRRREYLADASGALLTRYPEGLARALEKISNFVAPMRKASTATAHLFISDPFGQVNTRSIFNLFQTHPPVEKRIAALRSMS